QILEHDVLGPLGSHPRFVVLQRDLLKRESAALRGAFLLARFCNRSVLSRLSGRRVGDPDQFVEEFALALFRQRPV
ncbi:hypothetical protein, partial [Escherichia coli]|uniref:hypothetical protein n=1 Tax=Escherichia coli TaxID=562 RepID=UPI001953C19B